MIEWHNYNCTPNVLFDTNNTSYILVLWFFFVEMYFTDIIIIFVRLLKPFSPTCVHVRKTYVRAPSVWNTLPKDLRDTTRSVSSFKTNLCQFYNKLLDDIFDPEDSRTYKTVCIKCHSTRSLLTLSTSSCC